MSAREKIIDCLWTGGWDSTFRILSLLIIEKKIVQPYYLIDHRRKSVKQEMTAMDSIREKLLAGFPQTAGKLLPPIVKSKKWIRHDPVTRAMFKELDAKIHMGVQYEWFARFIRQQKIDELEVCIERFPDNELADIYRLLRQNLIGTGHECKLKEDLSEPALRLFDGFRFPVIHLYKTEMRDVAIKFGFYPLMLLTWYCFNPTKDGSPCGKCRPCQLEKQSGHRI
jgi:hypothetical protein